MRENRNLIPVKGHPGLYRDMESGAILNTNVHEFVEYRKRMEEEQKTLIEKENLQNKVNKLEEDIGEIKSLMIELIKMRNSDGN